jgi:hypothetical protein
MDLVRLAMPRRVYTQSHADYVVEVFEEIVRRRERLRGLRIVSQPRNCVTSRHVSSRWPDAPGGARHDRSTLVLPAGRCRARNGRLRQPCRRRIPLQVTVAGIEPLQGEGLELRMLVRLRVQNPNDAPFEFDGVSVTLDVQGKTFATGVAGESGVVPRFGETVVSVPVTVSVLRMVRQVMGVLDGKPVDTIRYEMSGKLSGTGFSSARFQTQGEFELPKSAPAPAQ